MSVSDARIHDQGYRRYDGPRLGTRHAVRSLARHTFQRILGLRRPARYKILPFLSVIIAYLPAAVFIGVCALAGIRLCRARIAPRNAGPRRCRKRRDALAGAGRPARRAGLPPPLRLTALRAASRGVPRAPTAD